MTVKTSISMTDEQHASAQRRMVEAEHYIEHDARCCSRAIDMLRRRNGRAQRGRDGGDARAPVPRRAAGASSSMRRRWTHGWTGRSPACAARMAFRLEFSAAVERDFELIFDHLRRGYLDFGESPQSALDCAETRIFEIRADAERILSAPHRGTIAMPASCACPRHLSHRGGRSTGSTSTSRANRCGCWRCSSAGRITSAA